MDELAATANELDLLVSTVDSVVGFLDDDGYDDVVTDQLADVVLGCGRIAARLREIEGRGFRMPEKRRKWHVEHLDGREWTTDELNAERRSPHSSLVLNEWGDPVFVDGSTFYGFPDMRAVWDG